MVNSMSRMSALVDQIAWLRRNGYEIILVSSGSIANGRGELKVNHKLDSVEQRQLFSAFGQLKLINLYYDLFREYDIHIGQILYHEGEFFPLEGIILTNVLVYECDAGQRCRTDYQWEMIPSVSTGTDVYG